MEKEQTRQYLKNTAINKIMKIYHPLSLKNYDEYSEEIRSEQRE